MNRTNCLLGRLAAVFVLVVCVYAPSGRVDAYDSPYWLGEYFDNVSLAGSPVHLQTTDAIAFDWGFGSPGAALPVDGFSARWMRPVELQMGTYRIRTRADDGVRVYIDDKLVLDEWRDGPVRERSVDVALGGAHLLRVEYYERSDVASVSMTLTRVEAPTAIPAPSSWRAEYFNNVVLSGSPVFVRNESVIDFDYGTGSPDSRVAHNNFSARWTRTMRFVAGYYRIGARVDDGVRVYFGDRLVLDDWKEGALRVIESPALFLAGDIPVRVEYFERAGSAALLVDFTPTVVEPVTPTPSFAAWRGAYYANAGLSGVPFITRSDRAVDFDWGQGAASAGLPADNFSVRWTRRLRFAPGSYRFKIRVDDGARVYIDDRLLIDEWREGPPRIVVADASLTEPAEVRVEYFDHGGSALVQFAYERIDRSFPDWHAEYFANAFLEGEPALVRNDGAVNFDWGMNAPAPWLPAHDFSVRWTRMQNFAAGWYRLATTVDDGMRVYIDGALRIDQWREGAVRSADTVVWINAGRREVRVEYFERSGGATARFEIAPSAAPTITPAP
ncbi:MAG: PA14 domain-containing protein [Chloroflexi bacterium]|nr:PA14 domain-containing protein [Chloroflexota bacterium]